MTKTAKHFTDAMLSLRRGVASHPGAMDVDEVTQKAMAAHRLVAEALRILGVKVDAEPQQRAVPCKECGKPVVSVSVRGRQKERHRECYLQHRKELEYARQEAAEVGR